MNIDQAADDLFTFIVGTMTGVPAGVKTRLRDAMRPRNHPHVAVVMAAELIYRRRADLPVSALTLGANLAEAAADAGAGGMNADGRGRRIGRAIRKMPGVEQLPTAPEADPDPMPDEAAPSATAPA